jgi:hypothetical protein
VKAFVAATRSGPTIIALLSRLLAIFALQLRVGVRIERGFVRSEDEPKSKAKAEEPKGRRPPRTRTGLRRYLQLCPAKRLALSSTEHNPELSTDGSHVALPVEEPTLSKNLEIAGGRQLASVR